MKTLHFLILRKLRQKRIRRKKIQRGGFLNRYDFTYAGQNTINQAFKYLDKIAPPLIQNLFAELKKIPEQKIRQIITHDRAELRKIGPKLLRGAIEDVHQTQFRFLGNFS